MFADSAAYVMKQGCRPCWRDYEEFEKDIYKVWSGARKFRVVADQAVMMWLGYETSDLYVAPWEKCRTLNEYAQAVAKLASDSTSHMPDRKSTEIYIIGYDESAGVRAFWLTDKIEVKPERIGSMFLNGQTVDEINAILSKPANKFRVEEIPLPSYMLCAASHEPEQILSTFINARELVKNDANGIKTRASDESWQKAIDCMLRDGHEVFTEISQSFPAFMPPWNVCLIDENGARQISQRQAI